MPNPAKPTALRLLEGDRSHRPPNRREPKPAVRADVPTPPDSLREDPIALATWNRLAPEVHRLGLLTVVDVELFESYCQANSARREYAPGCPKWHQAVAQMLSISKRYGFTPSDRAALKGPEVTDAEEARLDQPVRIGRTR